MINVGGDSGGSGGAAELVDEECHPGQDIVNASLIHLAHDLVQVLFLLLHHIL